MPDTETQQDLKLSRFITEERIVILKGRKNKADVLDELIDLLVRTGDIDSREDLAWGIFQRESLMSTAIGNGIAVPHIQMQSVDEPEIAVAICPDGITDYHSMDSLPVKIVFLIVAGKRNKKLHIRILETISRLFLDGRLSAAFLAAQNPETCMKILLHSEE